MKNKYDCLCIGSGPGGYSAALRLSHLGKSVAVIDYSKDNIGGVCLNEGCIPVKAIIKISKLYSELNKEGKKYGFSNNLDRPDMNKIVPYSKSASRNLKQGLSYLFNRNKIDFIEGEAQLLKDKKVKAKLKNNEEVELGAENIILSTGSKANELPSIRFDKGKVISSKEAINLKYIPGSIVIIGAGAIGVEFASIFCDLGAKVTLVEIENQILPGEDKEIASSLESLFKKKGIEVYTDCKTELISKCDKKLKIGLESNKDKKEIEADLMLLAVGRSPNIDKSAFKRTGIELDNDFVKVNEYMMTSIDGIYAVGDITKYPMFAHSSYEQSRIACLHITGKDPEPISQENIPRVVYSNPEISSIGLTEIEAEEKDIDFKVKKNFFRANSRAVLSNYKEGFVKILIDKNNKILGVHILGHEASELIHQFAICKSNGLKINNIDNVIFAHPSFSEIIKEASSSFLGRCLHE